jgi:hypothetical protein
VLKSLFNKEKTYFKKKTFTFYVPSPPLRRSGYQEKEFDNVIDYIVSLGFDLIDFKLQSHSGDGKSGMWIVCLLTAPNQEVYNKNINIEESLLPNVSSGQPSSQEIPMDPSIVHDV